MLDFKNIEQYEQALAHVNAIIQRISMEYKNITPIVPSDYALFSDFFNKEERHTYGNSWLYVTQGTFGIGPEKLGYKYYDGENLCAIAIYPKIEEPDTIMLYWIRPLGEGMLPVIVKLAEEIKQKYAVFSYVKKIFPDQYEYLTQHGFKSAKEFPWHSSTHSEDDTYPELIFDRQATLSVLNNSTNKTQLGRTLKEIKKFRSQNQVLVSPVNFTKHAWEIINKYFKIRMQFSNKINVSTPFDYYNMIFLDSGHEADSDRKILFVNYEPVGFYTLARDKKFSIASIYSYITLRSKYKYLTDLLKLFVFESEQVKYINAGGSEDEGIYNFKQKYLPVKENKMFLATNYSGGGREFQTN